MPLSQFICQLMISKKFLSERYQTHQVRNLSAKPTWPGHNICSSPTGGNFRHHRFVILNWHNGLLSDSNKPLHKPILTCNQRHSFEGIFIANVANLWATKLYWIPYTLHGIGYALCTVLNSMSQTVCTRFELCHTLLGTAHWSHSYTSSP